MMILLLTALTATLLFLNFPIFVALLVGAVAVIWLYSPVSVDIVVQTMYGSMDKFALMAVPFFILAAKLMERGGLSRRLIDWINSILQVLKGAVALSVVGSCMVFGAISGSSPATVVAIGSVLYPALREQGYPNRFSVGLITSSGAIGIIIPPSIAMIIFASITNVSVGALFLAGIGAGVMFGLCFAVYVMVFARRSAAVRAAVPFDFSLFLRRSREAAWGLGAPIIILGGIYAGVFTPTESAAVATLYALFVVTLVYRELSLRDVFEVAVESAALTGQLMIIVAASGIFAWLLAIGQAGPAMVGLFGDLLNEPALVFAIINVIFLLAGMFLDPGSAMVILVPLLFPIVQTLGLDPVHVGIVIIVNLAIGMFTPPFGLNLFVSTSAFNAPYREVVIGALPFIACAVTALVIVTYVPWISMYIPRLAYGG